MHEQAVGQGEVATRGPGRTTCRVLVVEGHKDTAENLRLRLQLWGHQVRVAHDGPTGLGVARAFRPQVVFLDLGMPGLSGFELAEQLRQQPGLSAALFVAMTGYGQADDRRRSKEVGCDEFFVKPVDPCELRRLLSRVGGHARHD